MKNVFFQRTSENTVFWNFGKNQLSISIMKPELSIITATYNAEATLPRTLKSVESQTFGWNIQHIIIDGASSDSTVALAIAYNESVLKYSNSANFLGSEALFIFNRIVGSSL